LEQEREKRSTDEIGDSHRARSTHLRAVRSPSHAGSVPVSWLSLRMYFLRQHASDGATVTTPDSIAGDSEGVVNKARNSTHCIPVKLLNTSGMLPESLFDVASRVLPVSQIQDCYSDSSKGGVPRRTGVHRPHEHAALSAAPRLTSMPPGRSRLTECYRSAGCTAGLRPCKTHKRHLQNSQ
jgi:hypothetical protein